MNEILAQWNHAAERYAAEQESSVNAELSKAEVRKRFTGLEGKTVLDAGCGYGVFTEYFREIGADAAGCDGSAAMLKIAEKKYPKCSFHLTDLQKKLPYSDGQFDLVFCNQVLMDIPDIRTVLQEFSRLLKENGILYLGIIHPAVYPGDWISNQNNIKSAKIIRDYTDIYQIEHEFCGKTTHFHRPVSVYFNLASEKGFHLTHMSEPGAYDRNANISKLPLFLFAEFEKYIPGNPRGSEV